MRVKELWAGLADVQTLRCQDCCESMRLVFDTFDEDLEGTRVTVENFPFLYCDRCDRKYLPSASREALGKLHWNAWEAGQKEVFVERQKTQRHFAITEVPFIYDSDDYYYIPGLLREGNDGYLTPVFFRKYVLVRFDNLPDYVVSFASQTYGSIYKGVQFHIDFGINQFGRVIMWLGDIARLPVDEQRVLQADNIESDHSVGSEFYDGQIEGIFTAPTPERRLIKARKKFHESAFQFFEMAMCKLTEESLRLIDDLREPITFSDRDVKNIIDTLCKLNVETLDSGNINSMIEAKGERVERNSGSLKRMEKLLQLEFPEAPVSEILAPLFVLNDLRTISLHLQPDQTRATRLKSVKQRLHLALTASFEDVYRTILAKLTECYQRLTALLESRMS